MLSYQTFFDYFSDDLNLSWLSDVSALLDKELSIEGGGQVGFLNLIRPFFIQLVGEEELLYLAQLGKNSRADSLEKLFSPPTCLVVMTDNCAANDDMVNMANHTGVALCRSSISAKETYNKISGYITNLQIRSETLHGVFMQVKGVGVLLSGDSGIGKSELALELVSHGHQLIADDAPEFYLVSPEKVEGRSPALLQDFLEVRGLGVLNIRAMYGDTAIKREEQLHLVIHLVEIGDEALASSDRLGANIGSSDILGLAVPQIEVLVGAGRNLRVLVEAAVSNFVLMTRGYCAAEEFCRRQKDLMEKGGR